jgi:regulator of sigma E protease
MLIVTIILGLVGLGLVVVVHEFGHYAAARAMGVEVEAFSIGWGPRIAGFKRKGTEWRFSALPLGGYCKMKGEESFRKALEDKAPEIPKEAGSFYGAAPWRRIVIALSGPIANVIFAVLMFIVISTIAYSVPTYSNKIVLLSEFDIGTPRLSSYPADRAGLKTGDRIVSIDGKSVADFSDLLGSITLSANKPINISIERDGRVMNKTITPMLDKDTGAGLIGITYWAEPVIGEIAKGSSADIAGLEPGDRITSIEGKSVRHAVEALSILLSDKPERAKLGISRGGLPLEMNLVLSWNEQGKSNLGIGFQTETHRVVAAASLGGAIGMGFKETWSTFDATLKGLGSLFQGVNLFKALSGPARITYMVGQSATEGIQNSSSGGLAVPLNFLAFLSIGLFIMNLLPIPALDGGQIVMFVIEGVRARALKPSTIYRYQAIGATFILAIFVIATVGDLLFFAAK